MAQKNFTSIDKLVEKKNRSISLPKEAEPMSSEKFNIQEAVEHEPDQEVEKFVNPRSESIELPPDLKRLGLQQTTTTKFPTFQNIKLPISDEKVMVGLHAPINTSIRWLATFALYLLARAHLGLKIIHGKVVRVFKN
ncbi:MAG: hypothetical protein UR89_C0006G0017 [Candidatus Roizmanbacteria bacterium GW2011_GWA2_35_8]|uniref:Uncharacterized protein n=1 Tax=Candidatus Roizmanbacteria bacterium GW2011_GWA2_35_8 TaxID=1618479 RepID=A0A0G0DES0_9BACT|nr:MAG: hypothetical protein UR89_C0006G0017 [Candidatus Roizmanbacteria bacterium GW2011_GWA2_35_8]